MDNDDLNNRLGVYEVKDGKRGRIIRRPRRDIFGNIIDQPGIIIHLDRQHYAVAPVGFQDKGEVEALKAHLASSDAMKKRLASAPPPEGKAPHANKD